MAVVKFPSLMPERSLMIATRQSMVAPCNFWNVIANAAWTSKTFARPSAPLDVLVSHVARNDSGGCSATASAFGQHSR